MISASSALNGPHSENIIFVRDSTLGRGGPSRSRPPPRRCALCSCGAIRTINFTPIEDLKAGTEGGREGVGGLAGEGIYLHTEVCTLQVTVLLSCLAYSAFKTMHSRLSYVSELDFTP